MDPNLVFAKTPIGDEAVRQSTRVVQRNLRMVLCLLYTSDAADERSSVDLGGRRIIKKNKRKALLDRPHIHQQVRYAART